MIEVTIITGIGIITLIAWLFYRKIKNLKKELKKAQFELRSAFVKFGKSFEHFCPFTKIFPSDKEKVTFLGAPLDFIAFDSDAIRFIEIKTGKSQLNANQKRIKKLIDQKKIEFIELRY